MNRMSRAGRERSIKHVLQSYRKKDKKGYLTVGQIARRLGLKSSTYLKNVLREMSENDSEIIHLQQGGMDMWRFQPYEQTSFLDRSILINGATVKVASWLDGFIGGVP